jgi:ribosomal protein S18 acetylase RimI-like enzyme
MLPPQPLCGAKFLLVLLAIIPIVQAFTTTPSRSAVAAPTPDVKAPSLVTTNTRPRHSSKQQQLNRLNLRSPFISVEVKPASRLEELLAVIDLRAEVFANPAVPLTIESKLRHIKHLLTRRAKGSVVLVATARDLLSPFSEEVVIGSLECSSHEFEDGKISPFLHDAAHTCKLYVTEMCVKETFRRQGVASSLLKAVDGVATSTRAAYVCLFYERINQGASRLYHSLEYHEVGRSPSVEAFAKALGLPTTSKTYGFFYKQFALSSAACTEYRTGGGVERIGAAAVPPSLTMSAAHTCVAGQQLNLWGKNHFSWW